MINDLILNQLPYVDGLPNDTTQQRISWIKNGDALTGASTNLGHDGYLNAAGLCIHTNTLTLQSNQDLALSKMNEVVKEVNYISELVDLSGNVEIANQIKQNTSDIKTIKEEITELTNSSISLDQTTKSIQSIIGTSPQDASIVRTLRDDDNWIKLEIGNYADQDINGQPSQGLDATGMKRRIMSNTSAISDVSSKLDQLANDLAENDLSVITEHISQIRNELGDAPETIDKTIYKRLSDLESEILDDAGTLDQIKTKIGFDNETTIDARVKKTETDITKLNEGHDSLVTDVKNLNTSLGNTNKLVETNGDNITNLTSTLGKTDSEGLRGEVAWIESQLGISQSNTTPTENSIVDKLNDASANTAQNTSAIQDIQTDIGNNTEGIKGKVNTLTDKMDGTSGSGTTIESMGVFKFSKALGTSKVSEAPNNSSTYARKANAWTELASSVANLSLATTTVTLTQADASLDLSKFTNKVSNNVTVASILTISSPGIYRIKLEGEVASTSLSVALKAKVSGQDALSVSSPKFSKSLDDKFIFGSGEEIYKLASGATITVTVVANNAESAVEATLNNIKLSVIPVL